MKTPCPERWRVFDQRRWKRRDPPHGWKSARVEWCQESKLSVERGGQVRRSDKGQEVEYEGKPVLRFKEKPLQNPVSSSVECSVTK